MSAIVSILNRPWVQPALVAIGLILTLAIQGTGGSGNPIRILEYGVRDQAQRLLSTKQPSAQIVVVDINEDSLAQVGAWPWTRSEIAGLASRLLQSGARIVVLDMVLPSARDPQGDQQLAQLAQERRLVLAQVFDYVERDSAVVTNAASGSRLPVELSSVQDTPITATGVIGNHAGLANAPCVGNIGFLPDSDGKLRRLPEVTAWQGGLYPSLGLATLNCLGALPTAWSLHDLALSYRLLRFDVDPEQWTVIPAQEILSKSADRGQWQALVNNRIVIVGASAMGLADRVATPLSPNISGVFVHAQSLSELMQGPRLATQWLTVLGPWINLGLVLVAGMVLLQRFAIHRITIALGLVLFLWLIISAIATQAAADILITAPLWGFLWLSVTLVPLQWASARQQARATTRLLTRYVAKPVLRELLRQQSFDPLKPRKLSITVLVADMADYSKTTASQSLESSARITREFLACITAPVWEYRGTLDRYTGDGLVAFWGAPISVPNQADQAIGVAQAMLHRLAELNTVFEQQGLPRVAVRIGIASGEALVGDFGTQFRATYTAVGTCINLAARLEAKAKELGVSVLVSESVAKTLSDQTALRYLASEDIRGIGTIGLYTLS